MLRIITNMHFNLVHIVQQFNIYLWVLFNILLINGHTNCIDEQADREARSAQGRVFHVFNER